MIERANIGLHDFLFDYLVKLNSEYNISSVLDIACGSGSWLNRFNWIDKVNLVGIDLDISQFSLDGIRAHQVNIDKYQKEVFGNFKLITCIELIEHLENPGLLLSLIKNNLSADGICLISTPNIHSLAARIRFLLKGKLGHFDEKSDATHIYPVYYENLLKLAFNSNLEVQSIFSAPLYSNYTLSIKIFARLLSTIISDTYSGDNIIFVLKHRA